jgi:hypothetical protein
LTPNFNIVDLVKILEKNKKLHIQIIEGDVMQNHEQKKVKKSEKPRFYGQNKLFIDNPAFQSLGSFSHMAACRSPLENT